MPLLVLCVLRLTSFYSPISLTLYKQHSVPISFPPWHTRMSLPFHLRAARTLEEQLAAMPSEFLVCVTKGLKVSLKILQVLRFFSSKIQEEPSLVPV